MATDVIIDPTSGQIYWNDSAGSPQSISIKGDAQNEIAVVGYSGSFSPGSSPAGAATLAKFNDNAGTSLFVPGTNGFDLGSATLRWNTYSTNANLSGTLVVADSTISNSLITGSVRFNGGIAISGNASIGQSLNFYNSVNANYVGFKAGSTAANTIYTLPTGYPGTGTSVLQSDTSGTLTWVAMATGSGSGLATTATNIYIATLGNPNSFHPVLMTPAQSSAGSAVSANGTVVYNPSTDILYTPGLAVTSGVDSSSTITGALQVRGGIGVTGTGYFDVVRTRAIVTTGDVTIAGNLAVNGSTIDFGNATTDSISFIGRVDTDVLPISDNLYDLGNNSLGWKNFRVSGVGTVVSTNTTQIKVTDNSLANYSGFKFTGSGQTVYTLPSASPTAIGSSFLSSALDGTMAWVAPPSGGGGTPGGTDTSIQFNDSSSFGGTALGFYFTKATHTVSIGSTAQVALTAIGLQLHNNNASSISQTQRWSPALEFMGRSFTPTGSVDYRVRFLNEIQTSTNTYAQKLIWKFSYDTGVASYTNSIFVLNSQNGVGIGATDATNINYLKTSSAQATDLAYTLPSAYPSGTGTSYLSASTTGAMAWVAAPSGGGGTPGGSTKQIQYNSSSTFAGAAGFEYTTGGIANTVSHFAASGTGYTSGMWIHSINGSTTRVGIGLSNPQFELEINGEISATNKSFVIDHPTKEGMKLRYGSLEGPENGVYVRGVLIGENVIETPDYWVGLVDPDTFTVNLTPIGKYSQLYVEKIEDYKVYIQTTSAYPIHCFFTIWAERKDIPKLVTEY